MYRLKLMGGTSLGSARLFSVRHEFPTEWAMFQGQTPAANRRFELSLNLRAEHYPYWIQTVKASVASINIFARSSNTSQVPASLTVFDSADQGNQAAKTDTLAKDKSLGKLLVGKFSAGARPP